MDIDLSNNIKKEKNSDEEGFNTDDLLESLEKALEDKDYVINKNTGVFHTSNSSCVKNLSEDSKEKILMSKARLEQAKLKSCKKCVEEPKYSIRIPNSNRAELDKKYENYLDKSDYNFVDLSEKYKDYWEDRIPHIEYEVGATIGLSRSKLDDLMYDYNRVFDKEVDKSIFELATREGVTLYRKQYGSHGSDDGLKYSVDIYKPNGTKPKYESIKGNDELDKYEEDDIIFQYDKDGNVIIREDLRKEAIYLTCEKAMKFKKEQDEETEKCKIEGHLYQTAAGNEYDFMEDLSTGEVFEDIDFVNDVYDGQTGVYQVQDGEYVKVQDGEYVEE